MPQDVAVEPESPLLIVFADDLTGAASTASLIRQSGSSVFFAHLGKLPRRLHGEKAVVVNTRTRDLSPREARDRLEPFIVWLQNIRNRSTLIGRRIDTQLRGPVSAEIDAITSVLKPDYGILSPAYPKAGRTSNQGQHFVGGQSYGDLSQLLAEVAHVRCIRTSGLEGASPGTWWIPSNEEPSDALHIAEVARSAGSVFIVDSGPVFAALVAAKRPHVLVVQGTSRPETLAQLESLGELGMDQDTTVYHAPVKGPTDPVLEQLRLKTSARLSQGDVTALVLGGGLTAETVLDALNVDRLIPICTPEPLVAISRIEGGPFAGTLVATKGGAIGDPMTLQRVIELARFLWLGGTAPRVSEKE